MNKVNTHEYELLEAISKDSMVTQATLSSRLGIAIGSVNWYVKRLINRGFVKVSHLDRTRLKYDLTPEGMDILTQRALQYMKNSLKVYDQMRSRAREVVFELKSKDIFQVYLDGDDEMMDILRLTCIEAGISIGDHPGAAVLKAVGQNYRLVV